MEIINQAISDSFLWVAVVTWILLYVVFQNPLGDGYHLVENSDILEWEETHLIAVTIPEFYIVSWLVAIFVRSGHEVVPFLQVDLWTVVIGLVFAARWMISWEETIKNLSPSLKPESVVRTSGFFVSILFGIGFSAAFVVATHPNTETIQFLYQRHINFAFHVLQQFQAILGLSIAAIQPHIDHTIGIYINNAQLSIKAGLLGALGGLILGLGIPAILIMGVNAAIIFGVFTGLLIRNTIAIGQPITAAPIGYLSSMGLLIVGHTFHEFMAILLVGVGGGFITYALVKSEPPVSGGVVAVAGFIQLAMAAFIEVWTDPFFINSVKGFITIEPKIVPLQLGSNWLIGVSSTAATTVVMVFVTAWMIRTTVRMVESNL